MLMAVKCCLSCQAWLGLLVDVVSLVRWYLVLTAAPPASGWLLMMVC